MFKIIESDRAIEKMILRQCGVEANSVFKKSHSKVFRNIKLAVGDILSTSPELRSLSGGDLAVDFGIPVGADVVSPIISAVVESIEVTFLPIRTSSAGAFRGGITISIQPVDFRNILSLIPIAAIITEKGDSLPWLAWLLLGGDAIIVADFGVEYGAGVGRSGGGHMVSEERPFKVDSRYSGTINDNFITRALNRHAQRLEKVIQYSLSV